MEVPTPVILFLNIVLREQYGLFDSDRYKFKTWAQSFYSNSKLDLLAEYTSAAAAAAAAKSLPGSPVPGILQARTLE